MTPESEILDRLRPLIVQVLAVEPEEVVPEAEWEADLGGESLDLIELGFYCDREFGVRLKFEISADDITLDERGMLTPESLARLRTRFPCMPLPGWENRRLNHTLELLTVQSLAGFVQMALTARTQSQTV